MKPQMSRTEVVSIDHHVFDGGPPLHLERLLGLVKAGESHVVRRAILTAATAWIPLVVLAVGQTIVSSTPTAKSFFTDFAVHARYLIAVPALIFAEPDCIPRFEGIARHFVDSGLIASFDMPRYERALSSTRRLLDSIHSDLLVLLVAYVTVVAAMFYVPPDAFPDWWRSDKWYFSPAGWWNMLVSLPILLILVFGWLWRLVLWGRFLVLMALLNLQLLPSHPDHVGGLKFVSTSLRGFRLISFAFGTLVAGALANRVVYHNAKLIDFKDLVVATVVFVVVVSAGPLIVFLRGLRQAKKKGIFEYGTLANRLGREFESKWLSPGTEINREILQKEDFSATTDLYSVAANVYEMRDLPIKVKDLIVPVLPALVPFAIVALLSIPLQVVIDSLIKLLL